jgi:hypothetical protein
LSTARVLRWTGLLALVLAYPIAVVLGPRAGLGVLLAAAVMGGNFLLMGSRLKATTALLAHPGSGDHKTLTGKAMVGGGIRWLLTFFLVWGLLKWFDALAVVAGLSCVVASITLQAFVEYLRAERDPSAGAGP